MPGMEFMMQCYEDELKHPIRNLVSGQLARSLLIQVCCTATSAPFYIELFPRHLPRVMHALLRRAACAVCITFAVFMPRHQGFVSSCMAASTAWSAKQMTVPVGAEAEGGHRERHAGDRSNPEGQ